MSFRIKSTFVHMTNSFLRIRASIISKESNCVVLLKLVDTDLAFSSSAQIDNLVLLVNIQ